MDLLHVTLALLFGALIGLLLGLLGGGGSILTVPVLVYIMGQSPRLATGTSLAIVGLNAAFGSLTHHRARRVRWRTGLAFGGAGVLGALGGTWLNALVSGQTILFLFAFVMLAAAAGMLRPVRPKLDAAPLGRGAYALRLGVTALGVGALTGFFGVGGGFLVVPALTLVLGLPVREAMATSLVAIAVNSAAGLVGRLGLGGIDYLTTALFAAGGLAGALAGGRWAGSVPERALRRWFAALVGLLALYLLYRNYGAVFDA